MKINKHVIQKLNPCDDRFTNYVNHYGHLEHEFDDFLDLENITYSDKTWVAVRVLSKNSLVVWSILCAENVLELFETTYPEDKRPRKLLEYLKSLSDCTTLTSLQKDKIQELRRAAAHAAYAAHAADADAAYAAAAANAAAYAAAAANAAADAAAYAAAAAHAAAANAAAYAAANAAAAVYAADARENQRNHNLTLLKMAASLDENGT